MTRRMAMCLWFLLLAATPVAAGYKPWPRLVVTDRAAPASLDPLRQSDGVTRRVLLQIYETLVYLSGPGEVQPLLAASWHRAGRERMVFELRRGVRFHNGEPFDARAAAFSLRRLMAAGQAPFLQGVRVRGPYRLEVRSHSPLLLPWLAYRGFMLPPRHTARGLPSRRPVGTGPYRFLSADSRRVRLAWWPGYWNRGVGLVARELIIDHAPDEDTRRRRLLSGLSQVVWGINPHLKLSLLRAGAQVRLYSQPSARQYFIVINPSPRRPANQVVLGRAEFRRALNLAVDLRRIIDLVLLGNGIPLNGPLNRQVRGWSPLPPMGYHPATARRVIQRLAPQGLKLTLAVPRERYVGATSVARAVARYLEQAGLHLEVRTYPWPEYLHRLLARDTDDWDLYYIGWGNPLREGGYTLSPEFCASPLARTCTPDIPPLLRRLAGLSGPTRYRLLDRLARRVQQLCPWIFLFQEIDNHATVRGLVLDPRPDQAFRVYYDLHPTGG